MHMDTLAVEQFSSSEPQAPPLRAAIEKFHRTSIADRIAPTRVKPMSTEKLTEQVAIKLCDSTLRQLKGVAEAAGTTPPELVRYLIEKHLEAERERYRSLHSIFADGQ